jgi:fumarate reductase subunit D
MEYEESPPDSEAGHRESRAFVWGLFGSGMVVGGLIVLVLLKWLF